jgi:putative oxidoreductase
MTVRDRINTLAGIGDKVAWALTWLPPLVARITIGVVFVQSGWGKLANLQGTIGHFRDWGIPLPELQAPFASASELVFGALVLIGLFTRFSAIPLMIVMFVALKTVAYDPQKAADEGTLNYLFGLIEYLYIVILLWLAIFGPGPISVDRIFLRRKAPSTSAPARSAS